MHYSFTHLHDCFECCDVFGLCSWHLKEFATETFVPYFGLVRAKFAEPPAAAAEDGKPAGVAGSDNAAGAVDLKDLIDALQTFRADASRVHDLVRSFMVAMFSMNWGFFS